MLKIAELQAGAARVSMIFDELPDEARLGFTTRDPVLLAALHRWFGAQAVDGCPTATAVSTLIRNETLGF